jgi:hypothetical protein
VAPQLRRHAGKRTSFQASGRIDPGPDRHAGLMPDAATAQRGSIGLIPVVSSYLDCWSGRAIVVPMCPSAPSRVDGSSATCLLQSAATL